MEKNVFRYSFKVWITSVLVAPALYIIASALLHYSTIDFGANSPDNVIGVYVIFTFCGALFSLVTFLVFFLFVWIASNICRPAPRKIFIFLSGSILTAVTFIALFGINLAFSPHDDLCIIMYANIFCIGFGSCFYKLKIIDENTGYFETNPANF